jgi:hypothetical protein
MMATTGAKSKPLRRAGASYVGLGNSRNLISTGRLVAAHGDTNKTPPRNRCRYNLSHLSKRFVTSFR